MGLPFLKLYVILGQLTLLLQADLYDGLVAFAEPHLSLEGAQQRGILKFKFMSTRVITANDQ